jgi:hypothetical protein
MKSRIWGAAVLVTLGVIGTAGGCGSDDEGGGGGSAGKDAATGGTGGTTGGTGGTGGTTTGGNGGTATGGNAGTTGCPAAPNDCNVCEGDEYASCACEAEETDCFGDIDCANIFDCVYTGTDGGIGPCLDVSPAGAACVLACADAFPAGKAKYLAYDGCVYCDYCKTACGANEYCDAFTGTGGTAGAAGAAGSTGTDAATDATSD